MTGDIEDAKIVRRLVERAMLGLAEASVAEQAEVHRAASIVLRPFNKKEAALASEVAFHLAEGERSQLKFRELLKS